MNDKKGIVIKLCIICSIFLFLVAGIIYFTDYNKTVSANKDILKYSELSSIDYKLVDKNGEYINTKEYNYSDISNIVGIFNYSFLGNSKYDYNYSYSIKAVLDVKDESGKSIFNNSYDLLSERDEEKKNTTGFMINQIVDINYSSYLDIINNAILSLNYDGITTSTLNVNLMVDTKSEILKKDFESKNTTVLEIPLGVDSAEFIKKTTNKEDSIKSKVSENILVNNNGLSYILAVIAIGLLFVVIICYTVDPYTSNTYRSEYRKVKRMVREYDELIKRTYKMPSIKDKDVKEISLIDEFINIFERRDVGMTMVEKETSVVFVIIDQDKAWTYSIDKKS